ncbi:hypothetical protein DPMN_175953 [Dreissena polymorpha]|uniref:Uncharacterized protein n=1 Tax=Dreissena polymorpha TaxID=45954 RepID=A0A9D4E7F9_DREPO|nr:hypothetical protein DPMN_175953 [Dreissena polymorpha]
MAEEWRHEIEIYRVDGTIQVHKEDTIIFQGDWNRKFQAQIGGKFAALNILYNGIDTITNSNKGVLLSLARKNKPWLTTGVKDLCMRSTPACTEETFINIDKEMTTDSSKKAYSTINTITKISLLKASVIADTYK